MKTALRILSGSLVLLLWWVAASTPVRAQAPAWRVALPLGVSTNLANTYTASDASGNVYLAGNFTGTLTFGGLSLTAANNGVSGLNQNFFVVKWSPARAAFVWATQGGGTVGATVTGLAVSGSSVYVLHNATAGSTFGAITPTGSGTVGVAKLTDSGSYVWAMLTGSTTSSSLPYTSALAVNGSSLYLAGSFDSSITFGTNTLTSPGGYSGYVARLTDGGSSASVAWAVPIGATTNVASVSPYALAVSGANVYVAGTLTGNGVFGSISLTSTGYPTSTLTDIFIARLTDAGSSASFAWAQQAGGVDKDWATTLAVSGTSLYLGGYFQGTATFGSASLVAGGDRDGYVARLTDTGSGASFAWTQAIGGSGHDDVWGLATDGTNVYATGDFSSTVSFGTTTLTETGGGVNGDAFATCLTSAGSFVWAQQAGGTLAESGFSIVLSGTTPYLAGNTSSPSVAFGSQTLTNTLGASYSLTFMASLGTGPGLTLAAPAGPVGSTITLYGAGLLGATAVTFAGTTNNVVTSGLVANAAGTQLTVTVPSGATTGLVSVSTARGTSNGVLFTVAPANPAPAWQALAPAGQAYGSQSKTYASATDATGNVFVTGYFSGTISFGSTTLTSAGDYDIFVAKWSPSANRYLWAQRAGGTGLDIARGIALNGSSVYLAGSFGSPTAAFGSTSLTNADATGTTADIFVAKLTDAGSSGSFTWALRAGGTSTATGGTGAYPDNAIGLAASGTSVYITGGFSSPFLNLGSVALTNTTGIVPHMYVAKLTDAGSSGSFVWAQQGGGAGRTYLGGIAVSGTSVYAGGYFANATVTFGSTTLTNTDATGSTYDLFVTKLTDAGTSGSFVWAQGAGGSDYDYLYALAASGNRVYLTGTFLSGTAQFGTTTLTNSAAATGDIFVANLTDAGSSTSFFEWAQRAGGASHEGGQALAVSGTDVYVGGNFYSPTLTLGNTTLANADASATATLLGSTDAFVAKYSDAGSSASVVWAQAGGGLGNDVVQALALSGSAVYVAGYLTPTAAFGAQAATGPVGGGADAFVAAINSTPLSIATSLPSATRSLYPNPAHDYATVPVAPGTTTVRVLDALGREVRRQEVAAGATEAVLEVVGLPAGLYLVRVSGASGASATQRLLVD